MSHQIMDNLATSRELISDGIKESRHGARRKLKEICYSVSHAQAFGVEAQLAGSRSRIKLWTSSIIGCIMIDKSGVGSVVLGASPGAVKVLGPSE